MTSVLHANEEAAAPPVGREARLVRTRRAIQLAMLAMCLMLPVSCSNSVAPVVQPAGVPDASQLDVGGLRQRLPRQRPNYSTPEAVLATIELAIDSKSRPGAIAYLRAFSDPTASIGTRTLQAVYDPAVLAGWQASSSETAPQPWDLALERGLPAELFSIRPGSRYEFSWTPDPSAPADEIAGDTMLVHRRYTLVGRSPSDPSGASAVILAVGSCDLSLERGHARWSIFRWVDHVDPGFGVNPPGDERSFTWYRLESLAAR
jgi:hypothetical protein